MMVVASFHKNPEMSKALSAKFRPKPFFKHKVLNRVRGKNFRGELPRREQNVHSDRDFDLFVKHLGLRPVPLCPL
ncbi:MAG TPA: hypothetical protein DCS21_02915 [Gammaproteobacteria bacterium]|nr:hypothetical protein [Gammaproteobacteria bacterium]